MAKATKKAGKLSPATLSRMKRIAETTNPKISSLKTPKKKPSKASKKKAA